MKPELKKALSKFRPPFRYEQSREGDFIFDEKAHLVEIFGYGILDQKERNAIGNEIAAHLNRIMEDGE